MKKDLVSILIVNWNMKKFLVDCFKSIFTQTYKNIEVIVVDNASSDGSQALLNKYARRENVTYIKSGDNLGFASGNNLALKSAQGEYILLLNADTKFKAETITQLVDFLKTHKKAAVVQPKLVFMSDNNKLDNVGAFLTKTGIPYYFGLYKDARNPKYNKNLKVYSAKGACMMIIRKVIKRVGFLDDYMFAYYEESDFCHRVWLAGYECWYTPNTTVEHYVGATYKKRDNITTIFRSYRNRIRSFIKNFELSTLFWIIPLHLIVLMGIVLKKIISGQFSYALGVLKAIAVNIIILEDTLKERIFIQKIVRKLSDGNISKYIFRNPRLSYYQYVGGGLEKYID